MHAPLENIAIDMQAEWGPAMQALPTEKQRAFVVAMFEVKPGRGAIMRAARQAGYGTATSSQKSISVIGSRLANDERIQLAMEEEGRRRFRTLGPAAHHALKNLLLNPKHRDHSKAVLAFHEHAMPREMRHKHEHEHYHVDHENEAIEFLRKLKALGANREYLENIFGCNGLPRLEQKLSEKAKPVAAVEIELSSTLHQGQN